MLYQQEITNIEGQKIKVSIFEQDGRAPKETEPRMENILRFEVWDEGAWHIVEERILEYVLIDKNDGS